jgi:predicted dehydrogenase
MSAVMRRAATLDLAVVGCGAVVERLYRGALRALEARRIARVCALVDPDLGRTTALLRQFPAARAFRTLDDALAFRRVALVIVTSPAGLHAEHAVAALGAGSDVLCEKPMAIGVADAERMVSASRAAGRILAVGMTRRMYPSVAAAREVIASGVLGTGLRFVHREGLVYEWPVATDAAFRRATAGGGVLVDLGSHALDLEATLLGALTVAGYADDAQGDGVETNCRIELDGPVARGVAQLSWNQPLVTALRITGTLGELVLDPRRVDALRWRRHGAAWNAHESVATWPSDLVIGGARGRPRDHHDCIYYQLVAVLRAIVHGEDVPADGAEGLAIARSIDACYERPMPLRLPWLPDAEQARMAEGHRGGERWAAA